MVQHLVQLTTTTQAALAQDNRTGVGPFWEGLLITSYFKLNLN